MATSSPLTRLPVELRQKILLYALYYKYNENERISAIPNYDPNYAVHVVADIRLGQHTLSALKLTSRITNHDATAVSVTWLSCLMLDLFDELEPIRARRVKTWKRFKSAGDFNSEEGRVDGSRKDDHRYTWISQMEMSEVRYHQIKLAAAKDSVWESERAYEDGVADFLEMCKKPGCGGEKPQSRLQSSLERQMVVCFGPAGEETRRRLAEGLQAGTLGICGDYEAGLRAREMCDRTRPRSRPRLLDLNSVYRWEASGYLPQFGYGCEESDWWRPYRPRERK